MSESFVAGPNRARRQRLLNHILQLLVCVLVASATSSTLEAQNKNERAATVKAKQSKAEKQRAWIVFEYNPAALDLNYAKSEYAFVAINSDGSAQAVRYGPYHPTIIGVYEGKLPKAEVALLLDKARTVIPKASKIGAPYVGSCDADSFQMSVISQRSKVIESKISNFACLPVMPKEIFELAQEMRTVWKRLSKVPLAYGYLRRSPFEAHLLKSAELSSSQLIAVSKLSRDRRAIIRNAIKHSPKFYALSREQYDQLKALTHYPSRPFDFDVVDNGRGYSLALVQSRGGFQALNEDHANLAKHRNSADVEIRLAFNSLDPNFDDSTAPLFIAISRNGQARAVRYQLRYHANSIAAYEGMLSEEETERWFARVGSAFHLPKHRADYDRGLVYESDGFYLSVLSRNDKAKEMFGSLETRPEEIRALVPEMSKLWRRLSEVQPAYAYLTYRPIEKDRLKLLRTKYKVDPTPIESLPSALQSLLISVVTQPRNLSPLTPAQYEQLNAGKLAVTYKTKGYELLLFLSAKEAQPQK